MFASLKKVCFSLLMCLFVGNAHAYLLEFTNSNQTWGATDSIVLLARLTNDSN
jgi:hypothetical protein